MGEIATPSACPYCEKMLDAAEGIKSIDAKPEPGDVTICIYCSQISFFADDLTLRRPHPGELEAAYTADPNFKRFMLKATEVIRSMDRRNPKG